MQARKVEVKSVDFNGTFITRMIPKIDWSALRTAAKAVSNSTTQHTHKDKCFFNVCISPEIDPGIKWTKL